VVKKKQTLIHCAKSEFINRKIFLEKNRNFFYHWYIIVCYYYWIEEPDRETGVIILPSVLVNSSKTHIRFDKLIKSQDWRAGVSYTSFCVQHCPPVLIFHGIFNNCNNISFLGLCFNFRIFVFFSFESFITKT
jgi:hypothetical protein